MRLVLLQADDSAEVRNSEAQRKDSGKWEFDKSLIRMCLRPISFISISMVLPLENSRHRFVGETDTVSWSVGKSRNYLWGDEFIVISYCSRLQQIFESEANLPHVVHIWGSKLLQYKFLIWHRPEILMWEFDIL